MSAAEHEQYLRAAIDAFDRRRRTKRIRALRALYFRASTRRVALRQIFQTLLVLAQLPMWLMLQPEFLHCYQAWLSLTI